MATKQEGQLMVPLDNYLKAGLHIGTKYRTKYMSQFIYKVRPDGLAVLNVQKIDERLKLMARFLSQYDPEGIIVVCRRENGWKRVELFSKLTGIRSFTGRYPPGILTNPNLENFIEAKLMLVVDPWIDRNAVKDAIKVGIPVMGICDTNNESNNLDFVMPGNNKGKKSLGLIFYVLAREYLKLRGKKEMDAKLESFVDE